MIKKLLFIEDDEKKIEDVKLFVESSFPKLDLTITQSYQSGLKELINSDYDLLLLDMSIPTWDSIQYEPVDSFEKFGGFKIMRELTRRNRAIRTILITMFDDFGESDSSITVSQIDLILKNDFSAFYLGYVFYNSKENNWKNDLKRMLDLNNTI